MRYSGINSRGKLDLLLQDIINQSENKNKPAKAAAAAE